MKAAMQQTAIKTRKSDHRKQQDFKNKKTTKHHNMRKTLNRQLTTLT